MKKSELKKEIKNLKTQLKYTSIAHINALRYIARNKIKSDLARDMDRWFQAKKFQNQGLFEFIESQKNNPDLRYDPSKQAGDKIVETNNSNWFIKNDDGTYTIKLDPSFDISKWLKKEDDSNVTSWNDPIQTEPTKETHLTDLAKEVDIEKKANELIDKFMPLVNGWVKAEPNGCVEAITVVSYTTWYYNSSNQRKAAIKCAIQHLELDIKKRKTSWLSTDGMPELITQLQKMLSE
jgi:hypothetical protein